MILADAARPPAPSPLKKKFGFASSLSDLKRDMPGQMRRIAAFLDLPVDEARWPPIVEYCSFDWMKRNVTQSVPLGGAFWDGGAETFIHKGVNGRWADTLTPEDCAEYELGAACARWLANGGLPA